MATDAPLPAPARRRLLALLGALPLARGAGAQTRTAAGTLRLIVPAPAGGSSDRIARIVAEALAGILETTVDVDNVPGNAGVTGTNAIAGGATDGSLLGIVSNSTIVSSVARVRKSLRQRSTTSSTRFSPTLAGATRRAATSVRTRS